jgi:hypothetical protein
MIEVVLQRQSAILGIKFINNAAHQLVELVVHDDVVASAVTPFENKYVSL